MKVCSIEGCTRPVKGRGWCTKHYQRWAAHGDPETLLRNRGSGRTVQKKGYVVLLAPGHPTADAYGHAYEHRLVAWNAGLLRDLREQVHHLDGNKSNNAVENLEVLPRGVHSRLHQDGHLGRFHRAKTHCPQGHPYSGTNLYVNPSGRRECRACKRERAQRR